MILRGVKAQQVATQFIEAGEDLVRIFATDGLRTTVVERAVKVPDKAPEVSIVATQHGPVNEDGFATIGLRGTVYDAEGHKGKEVAQKLDRSEGAVRVLQMEKSWKRGYWYRA